MIKKKEYIIYLLILISIPFIHGVTVTTGTNYYDSTLNLWINCTSTYYADLIVINESGIYFSQFNSDNSATDYMTFMVSENNKNYDCSALPVIPDVVYSYSESVDTATYTIPSGLGASVNANIYLKHTDCFTAVGNTLKLNLNTLNYTCSNGYLNLTGNINPGVNQLVISYNKQPQAGGGGGGGGDVVTMNVTPRLCELTYKYADNKTYTGIDDIINIYKIETNKTESFTNIKDIIDNWQKYCSDKIQRTTYESYVCGKLYFFVLNDKINLEGLNDLRNDMKSKVTLSLNLIDYYLKNYDSMCYKKGLSGKLSNEQLMKVNITIPQTLMNCSVDFNSEMFNFYLPLGKWNLGMFDSCDSLDIWKYVFALKSENGSYYLIGLRLYIVILLLLIIGVYSLFRLSKPKSLLNIKV